jgi:MFS family permease
VPVLFLDFMVIALPRSILPQLLDAAYGKRAYTLLGMAEAVRGTLTFLTAPMLGALSDVAGRKWFFIACIVGTAAPSAVLAITPRLDVFLGTLAGSGLLASTFPLAFAHIADHVPRARRSAAFGLATGIGLGGAFTIGPAAGATIHAATGDTQIVFDLCLWLTAANALIAVFTISGGRAKTAAVVEIVGAEAAHSESGAARTNGGGAASSQWTELRRRANPLASWSLVRGNDALWTLSLIVFLYYLSLWGFIANSLLCAPSVAPDLT